MKKYLFFLIFLLLIFNTQSHAFFDTEYHSYSGIQTFFDYNNNIDFSGFGFLFEGENSSIRITYENKKYNDYVVEEIDNYYYQDKLEYKVDKINSLNFDFGYLKGNTFFGFGGLGLGINWHKSPEEATGGYFSSRIHYGLGIKKNNFRITIEKNHTLKGTTAEYSGEVDSPIRLTLSIGFYETEEEHQEKQAELREKRRNFIEKHNISSEYHDEIIKGDINKEDALFVKSHKLNGEAKEKVLSGDMGDKIRKYINENKDELTTEEKDLLIREHYYTGMTKKEAKLILGEPDDINTTVTKYSRSEQWIYEGADISDTRYFYFEDDELTGWQN